MNARRLGVVFAPPTAAFATVAAGVIASSNGSAMTVPNPFKKVRRGSRQFLVIISHWSDEVIAWFLQSQMDQFSEQKSCSKNEIYKTIARQKPAPIEPCHFVRSRFSYWV